MQWFDSPTQGLPDYSQMGALGKIGMALQNIADPNTIPRYQMALQQQGERQFIQQQRENEVQKQSALAQLAADPSFANMAPAQKFSALAAIDPSFIDEGLQFEASQMITPYQQQQLALERQRLALAGRREAPNLQFIKGEDGSIYTANPQTGQLTKVQEGSGPGLNPDLITAESGLRKEFMGANKEFSAIQDGYSRFTKGATVDSPAGDISLIFGFMRMNDPNSTVREGEFATAQNAAGIPDQVRNAYNKALTGERLSPSQRQDFLNTGKQMFQGQYDVYKGSLGKYREIAKQYSGINPERAVPDIANPGLVNPPALANYSQSSPMQNATDFLNSVKGSSDPIAAELARRKGK